MDGSITHRAEIESFIMGQEYGAESLVVNGEIHVLGIMKKWMTEPPYYAELGHAIPCGLPENVENKVVCCVEKALRALNVNHGSVNMDMLITPEGNVHIIDIGARMGGNLIGPCIIPYGTGIDYMANMLRCAVGDPLDWEPNPHGAVATRLLAFGEGDLVTMPDMRALEETYDVEIYHHMTPGMHIREYHTNLDGCGYVVARGDRVEDAEELAAQVRSKIERILFGGSDGDS